MEKYLGTFCKLLKIKKTIVYAFKLRFAELKYYQRRSERLFELILVCQSSFCVCYIRVFVNFLDDPYRGHDVQT